ncbi:Kinesin protein 1B [Actinomortierella ambigua]|nr:Kinesin protein 1B [Actinomortierella ambigua]
MAPKTPQGGSSKLPKPPSAGGAIPLTGIPGPNVLQRRTFANNNNTTSTPIISKALSNMTLEQQALLAEAISMHSPGLIDPTRTKPNISTSSNAVAGSGPSTGSSIGSIGGMSSASGGSFGSGYINTSTNSSNSSASSGGSNRSPTAGPFSTSGASTPTSVASPLSHRSSSSSQLGNQRRLTGNGAIIPGVDQALQQQQQTSQTHQLQQQFSRPSSYTSTSPVPRSAPGGPMTEIGATTATASSLSPTLNTNPSTLARTSALAGPGSSTPSPSSARPSLPMSRLSGGPGVRAGLLRQPGLTRPTAVGTAPASGQASVASGSTGAAAVVPPSLDNYEIGDRVIVESMDLSGYLRFLGSTEFKTGTWAGIELDTPTGKNDGSVNGIEYFQCRPKHGIFVLAAKIAKSESLFPTSPVLANARPSPIPPVSAALLSGTQSPPPHAPQQQAPSVKENQNHAAQAASRITAGSRASKYIGMTASQLKQRNGMAQTTSSTTTTGSRLSLQSNSSTASINTSTTSVGMRAASPTVRSPLSGSGSPTNARTIGATTPGVGNRASSPSPAPRLGIRANSPTTRATGVSTGTLGGSRLALAASKSTPGASSMSRMPGTTASATTTHSRSTSSTSSVTSAAGPRARTSPTPSRVMTTPRRLSSRSDTPDTSHVLTPYDSRANLLDQATAVQATTTGAAAGIAGAAGVESIPESPQDENFAQKIHQLQLDLGVMVAENNLLKTEVNQARSQLESARLMEKRNTLDDERLGKELEELHSLKEQWEKDKKAKDQEIQVMTEKMTQAWLEVARSAKEKTALQDRLKALEEAGGDAAAAAAAMNTVQQQQDLITQKEEELQQQLAKIESLQRDLADSEERSKGLESQLEEVTTKITATEKAAQEASETLVANENEYTQKLAALTQERDGLQATVAEMESLAKTTMESSSQQLADLTQAAEATKEALESKIRELEAELKDATEGETEAAAKILAMQSELSDSERRAKLLEEKTKELEGIASKREQEIASLKLELEDIAGMVQSEEVERMRKVWENEKKRLEEAVADNITVITNQREEIQMMEQTEEALEAKVKELESTVSDLTAAKESAETEMTKVKERENSLKSSLEQEKEELRKSMEAQLNEAKEGLAKLEEIAQTVDEWRDRCEAMQLEVIQKTTAFEDIGFQLSDSLMRQEKMREEHRKEKQTLEEKLARESARLEEALSKSHAECKALEEEQGKLKIKISELETALTVSASTPSMVVAAQPNAAVDSDAAATIAEQEEEIANLKQMVHDLTRENIQVASINKKLMQEHDNLMEAHRHVETECLKLMDEVERLHAENLSMPMSMEDAEVHHSHHVDIKDEIDMIHAESNAKAAMNGGDVKKAPVEASTDVGSTDDKPSNQSESVIRLENLLKEKQALLDRLTQQHSSELKELRQKIVELDRSKAWEVQQLNKELTELESLIESKIFHEADLEEEVQLKQKQIDRLEREVADLKAQLRQLTNGGAAIPNGSSSSPATGTHVAAPASAPASTVYMPRSTVTTNGAATSATSLTSRALQLDDDGAENDKPLFCEICEVEGHDIISCVAVFGGAKSTPSPSKTFTAQPIADAPVFREDDIEDDRPYCDNCEEFGDHWTDECPNESLTY